MRDVTTILDARESGSRLRFRSTVVPVPGDKGSTIFFTGSRHYRVKADPVLASLVDKLVHGFDSATLVSAVVEEGLDPRRVVAVLEHMAAVGLLFEERRRPDHAASSRYARQLDLFGLAETNDVSRFDMQDRLRSAHVAQIGLGGLGTWIALGLAPTGIGRLTLIDGDVVARSNLNRQVLYSDAEVGATKVSAAGRRLHEVNPDVVVEGRASYVDSAVSADRLIPPCDLLIVSADEPFLRIRTWVTEVCQVRRIPHVFVAAGGVGPLVEPGGADACWACLEVRARTVLPELDSVVGVLEAIDRPRHPQPITPGYHPLLAGAVVLEAIRYCSGFESPATRGAQLVWEGASSTMARHEIPTAAECPHHTRHVAA